MTQFHSMGIKQHFSDPLPTRVRLLILGGGIHGVGILHDMASRGWRDCHLVEKHTLGFGTSSRSTKLIHGGLRYLKRIQDFGLVAECLSERAVLMHLAPDLVKPIELFLPVLKQGGMPGFVLKTGLHLYDFLSRKERVGKKPRTVSFDETKALCPILDLQQVKKVLSFWDAQTDDLGLVYRVAESAQKLGAGLTEKSEVVSIKKDKEGFLVDIKREDQSIFTVSALYVVNALGPWANDFLQKSTIEPPFAAINNKGTHLICKDVGLKVGLFLQSPDDQRIFFVLPWQGKTLLGTTESLYTEDPEQVEVTEEDVFYLLERANRYFTRPIDLSDIEQGFSGLRFLPKMQHRMRLSQLSRDAHIGEIESERGLLFTIYGGKLTSYRKLAERLGDRITTHFGTPFASKTHEANTWKSPQSDVLVAPPLMERFSRPPLRS